MNFASKRAIGHSQSKEHVTNTNMDLTAPEVAVGELIEAPNVIQPQVMKFANRTKKSKHLIAFMGATSAGQKFPWKWYSLEIMIYRHFRFPWP